MYLRDTMFTSANPDYYADFGGKTSTVVMFYIFCASSHCLFV